MGRDSVTLQYLLDQDEVNALINASETPVTVNIPERPEHWYETYSAAEAAALIACDYDPSHFDRRK
jgi:hypothetical protein